MASNEYLKDGVLYRDDMKVGADGLNSRERADKKAKGSNAVVGADGLTSRQRANAKQKEIKQARAYSISLLIREFNLVRNGRGTAWTHTAVAAYMARTMDFYVTGEYKNARKPLEGFCLRCGDLTPEGKGPEWTDILNGKSACNSNACGGKRMPTENFMSAAFLDRGFELVNEFPKGRDEKFFLKHVDGESPCQQNWKTTWQIFFNKKSGCGVCRGKQVVAGFNDLSTKNPTLAAEMLSPDPTTVTEGSGTKAKWKCNYCGRIWDAMVRDRSRGNGCPECQPRGYDLSTPNGTLYVSNYATSVDRPRLRVGKYGITKEFGKRRKQHKKTSLNFREGSISMLSHVDPYVAYYLEKQIHNIVKGTAVQETRLTLTKRGKTFKPRELFRVNKKLLTCKRVKSVYDLLDWVQLNDDSQHAAMLGIADEMGECCGEFVDGLPVYSEL